MQTIEQELARLLEADAESACRREGERWETIAAQRTELERRLIELQHEQAEREQQRLALLLAVDEGDRRNYRNYWEARLAYALEHAQDSADCDPVVRSVLLEAGVPYLVPVFAKHRVDAVVLRILGIDDLERMGVTALGDQKRILMAASQLFQQTE